MSAVTNTLGVDPTIAVVAITLLLSGNLVALVLAGCFLVGNRRRRR